jgi:hypothetical protein
MNPCHTKFMLSLHAAADARRFHLTEVYKTGGCTINLSSRSMFILHLNTPVLMNICENNFSWVAAISLQLKPTVVNSFNIHVFMKHFPETVAFMLHYVRFWYFVWYSSEEVKRGRESKNQIPIKFVIWNFVLFIQCMFLHQYIIQDMRCDTQYINSYTFWHWVAIFKELL